MSSSCPIAPSALLQPSQRSVAVRPNSAGQRNSGHCAPGPQAVSSTERVGLLAGHPTYAFRQDAAHASRAGALPRSKHTVSRETVHASKRRTHHSATWPLAPSIRYSDPSLHDRVQPARLAASEIRPVPSVLPWQARVLSLNRPFRAKCLTWAATRHRRVGHRLAKQFFPRCSEPALRSRRAQAPQSLPKRGALRIRSESSPQVSHRSHLSSEMEPPV